jgi:hypothetical protein
MEQRNVSFFFVLAVFAAGAVTAIIWKQNKDTCLLCDILGTKEKTTTTEVDATAGLKPASLAGTAIVPTAVPSNTEPNALETGSNWSVN